MNAASPGYPDEDGQRGGDEISGLRRSDVEALGALHCLIWQVTYRGLLSQEAYDQLTPERFARGWGRRADLIESGQPLLGGERVLVARHSGQPVGFISVGEPRDEDPPVPWQLWALNVLPEQQGTGLAQRLVARALGGQAAYLWVARGNDRAIRFYRREGFALDGTQHDRGDGIVELRMVRRASA